ncbi:MAG: alpha/beta hydrolase family protein [Aliihoeflea sp.]
MKIVYAAAFAAGLATALTPAIAQDATKPATEASQAAVQNRIDIIRPDAPELAAHGDLPIGVRTVEVTNADQIDVANTTAGGEPPRYDRKLTLEIWYPAAEGTGNQGTYTTLLRDGETEVTLTGRGVRDAEPAAEGGPFPLVIISHGYPGNRLLLSHLAENLATKGYVVASIDHLESTYADQGAFGSTLVNRSLDQLFVLDEIERMNGEDGDFLSGLVDTANAGLIGYSMGGYGAVITAGAGVTETSVGFEWGAPAGTLAIHQAGSPEHEDRAEPRIKAVVAFAPWGRQRGFWDAEGMKGIETPIFYVAGSVDDVSGYEDGVKTLYEETVNAERYLLTFENANHNAAAPMPAPAESWEFSEKLGFAPFDHYADPVWDTVRMNNIAQHFVTAFLGKELKGDEEMGAYLDLVENAADGVTALDDEDKPTDEHTYWKGFADRTAVGLSLMHAMPAAE